MDRIIDRLDQLGFDGVQFCRRLKETNTIMAGSFPLQCVLGKTFTSDRPDIDLYCHLGPSQSFPVFGQWLYWDLKMWASRSSFTAYNDIMHLVYHVDYSPREESKVKGIHIQIMIVDNKIPVNDFIETYFDLSFCKVYTDGVAVTVSDPETLQMKGTFNPLYMSGANDATNSRRHYRNRIEKYQERGFTITNLDEFNRVFVLEEPPYDHLEYITSTEFDQQREKTYQEWHQERQSQRDSYENQVLRLLSYRLLGLDGCNGRVPFEIRRYITYWVQKDIYVYDDYWILDEKYKSILSFFM